MPLIIDGNNLLHSPMPPVLAGLEELGLCRLLARGPWRRQRVVVVCDGEPGPLRRVDSPEADVELIYSGPNHSADDRIIAMIDADSAPRRLVVVSDDREIQRAARRRRAKVCSTGQFIYQLVAVARAGTKGSAGGAGGAGAAADAKGHAAQLDIADVNTWLERFGLDGEEPLDEPAEPWTDVPVD